MGKSNEGLIAGDKYFPSSLPVLPSLSCFLVVVLAQIHHVHGDTSLRMSHLLESCCWRGFLAWGHQALLALLINADLPCSCSHSWVWLRVPLFILSVVLALRMTTLAENRYSDGADLSALPCPERLPKKGTYKGFIVTNSWGQKITGKG